MSTPPANLEPTVPDPRKIRRTGILLVLLMVVSGIGILISYNRSAKRKAEDTRPAVVGRLMMDEDLKLWRQDESEAGLLDLAGDVFVIAPVSFEQPDSWATTREILEGLKERYADRKDFHIVCLTVDPENESPLKMGEYAVELGAELPFWWLAGTKEESTHKYLKNKTKAAIMPHQKDGQWIYDPSLIVVDRDRHLRKATIRVKNAKGKPLNYRNPVPFNFEEAAGWDAEGRSEGLEASNVETLREMLHATLDEALETPKAEK